MAQVSNLIYDNPQQPMAVSEAYIPDQLIAGNLKLVTDGAAILTGGAALQRGTVVGRVTESAAVGSTGRAAASGTIGVAAVPPAGDTVTINGTALTFAAAPGNYQEGTFSGLTVYVQPTAAANAQALTSALVASTDVNLSKATYSLSGSTITVTSKGAGTGGNSISLATSDTGAFALSGANLSGGTANTGNATIGSISPGLQAKPGNYTAVCSGATTANVFDPSGASIGSATFGTPFTNPEIGFTIAAGSTPCAAGDAFQVAVPFGSGAYRLAQAGATDGSQIPAGILVDYADASAGDVSCGVYLMGEFNASAIMLDPSISVVAARNALRPLGIFLKNVVSASDPS